MQQLWERAFLAKPSDDAAFQDEICRLILLDEGGGASGFADVYRPCVARMSERKQYTRTRKRAKTTRAPTAAGGKASQCHAIRLRAVQLQTPDSAASALSALQSEVGDRLLYACHGEVVHAAGGEGAVVSAGGLMTGIPAHCLEGDEAFFSMARPLLVALLAPPLQ